MNIVLKKCTTCQESFAIECFPKWNKGKDGTRNICKDCYRNYNNHYRKENAKKLRESHKTYDRSPKGIYKKLTHSPRKHKVLISQESFMEWYNFQPKVCSYCGITEEQMKLQNDAYLKKCNRLTIDRMDSSKPYVEGNLTLACLRCNHIKGDFFTASEMEQIGKIFISKKWNYGNKI